MNATRLPKAVRSAISRNAHRLAMQKAYLAMRAELEDLACALTQRPDAMVQSVIDQLDHADVDYVPRTTRLEV